MTTDPAAAAGHGRGPTAAAVTDLLAAMQSTLSAVGKTFDVVGEHTMHVAALGPAVDAMYQVRLELQLPFVRLYLTCSVCITDSRSGERSGEAEQTARGEDASSEGIAAGAIQSTHARGHSAPRSPDSYGYNQERGRRARAPPSMSSSARCVVRIHSVD